VKIRLSWQRRAVIIFAATIFLLGIILAIFAIREAEREKLIREREIEEDQQRSAELIVNQVNAAIAMAEGRIARLVRDSQIQSNEKVLAEVCKRIKEDEEIVNEIFLIKEKGEVIFPLVKPLFILTGEEIRERLVEIEADPLLKTAEISEFKTKNYSQAIKSYQEVMDATSDRASRALLMNCIGRCYTKSRKHPEAVEAYQNILKESPSEVTSDGIPLGIIAQYQIGSIYWENGKKIKADEAFFELYNGLLESRWPLTKTQFHFYRNKVKAMLKTSTADININETRGGESLMKKWNELERLEEEKLRRMNTIENLTQKVIPLIETKRPLPIAPSGRFHHLSETIGKELYLVSYTPINENTVFGIRIDSDVLAEKLLPPILDKLPLRKEWHIQVKDELGNTLIGEDVTNLKAPIPHLAFSRSFEENFPPWKINIFQSELGLAQRQFNLRRNIYILSVAVVVLAILFGGFLAIKSTAKELELAKLKSEFVSTVSHELRTPLTSIRYLTELLQRGRVQGEDKKHQYYETITRESGRLSILIENILDFSTIEAGMKEYKFEETDIAELAKDVASRFEEQVDRKEFIITSEIKNQMPKVLADREAISRALFNLLDNALKYSGKVRNVFLRAWAEEESVFLEVEDEGIGISKEEQKKIFEKFYRCDNARESDTKGSGIGLTLVAHIVKAHRGEVMLESDEGKGTKVTIKLPVKRTEEKKANRKMNRMR